MSKHLRFKCLPDDPTTIELRDAGCDCFISRWTDVASIGWDGADQQFIIQTKPDDQEIELPSS